jgi:filamentous hemagglutinin family protein
MKKLNRESQMMARHSIFGLALVLGVHLSASLAQAVTPITPSGLNTQVNLAPAPPPGKVQYDITGGTRPGGGLNLYHSFGDFNVPNNNIANFLNNTGLPTSNILGRVNGGNISNIFGTIQTTGFGNANLFLMNPAGFLFGPNATVNVGGMVSFTSADYLRLADGVRFNAVPKASADALLSAAPVAAFGFLGSNPGAITVQGSQLTVAEGTGISLVGGNITVQSGATLTAPNGTIALVSVGKPSNPHVAGEVTIAGSGQGTGFTPTNFKSLGTINLSQGSTIKASAIEGSVQSAPTVLIRGGQLVVGDASIQAVATSIVGPPPGVDSLGGIIDVTAEQVTLSQQYKHRHIRYSYIEGWTHPYQRGQDRAQPKYAESGFR